MVQDSLMPLTTGTTTRVSVASDGEQGNSGSSWPSISADGRYVAFESYASDLVGGDTNGYRDIFVHNRETGETSRVSVASDGGQGNGESRSPSISADGCCVAFYSYATNLVSGDTNGKYDIFVHNQQTGETTRVSLASDGGQGNEHSFAPFISANGRYIAFHSYANNLVSGDTNGYTDVFVHALQTGETTRVSVTSDGIQGNDTSYYPSISTDGRYVAFYSAASNLIPDDTNGKGDIFVHDRQTGETTRVSVAFDGEQGNDRSWGPFISADGRYVAFDSAASNLVGGDTNGENDIFVHDRQTGETICVSVASDGGQGNGGSHNPSISADGRYVAFYSDASNLVGGDTNGTYDIFVHDRQTGETARVSVASDGSQGNDESRRYHSISADGRYVAFCSYASNLVGGDTNGEEDVFVHDRGASGPIDIGFLPNPDGYSFPNYGGNFPLSSIDFTAEDVVRMFGADAACAIQWPVCVLKWSAARWEWNANRAMNGGHCDGMASTTLRFFKGLDNLADFQAGVSTTHDLQLSNVREHIAYYFVEQMTDPVQAYKEQVRQNTPSAILDQLRSAMSGGAPDPTTLFVRQAGQGGHAITPYAIEDQGNRVYWVQVYDNNHPDDANRHVEINTTDDTWNYDMGGGVGTWSGNASTHSLGIVPISKYAEQPVCPWCSGTKTLSGSSSGQVWLIGQGHLLLTDSQGRHIGYVTDQFVNEIPGAYGGIVDGGIGIEMEPIYHFPLSDTYTILLDGQTLTQTETVAVTQFGPGYAVSVDDVLLGPTSQDGLVIAPDGTQLAYQSGDAKEATLTLALDGASESDQFQVSGADVGAGQVVTLTADVGNGQLVFDNAQSAGGVYDLEITRVSTAGKQTFLHAGLVISATDTHFVDYGAWDGSGPITVCTDYGSNGTTDDCSEMENQANRIYLPLILRNY